MHRIWKGSIIGWSFGVQVCSCHGHSHDLLLKFNELLKLKCGVFCDSKFMVFWSKVIGECVTCMTSQQPCES
jgi:hypothetical protein